MANSLVWNDMLFCNGEIFCQEHEWKTPNTYNNNFAEPPEKPGIYVFVVYVEPNDRGNIVYIGSSVNLSNRYHGHRAKIFLYEQYWYVRFYFKETENFKEEEKRLIQKFQPKFNIQHKGRRSINHFESISLKLS